MLLLLEGDLKSHRRETLDRPVSFVWSALLFRKNLRWSERFRPSDQTIWALHCKSRPLTLGPQEDYDPRLVGFFSYSFRRYLTVSRLHKRGENWQAKKTALIMPYKTNGGRGRYA